MNLERISDALQSYTGQEDSMRAVTDILQEELGDNWTETVFQDLQVLPPALRDNLTHVYNYYAATMAWNETQEYLADANLSKTPELEERLPILKHWLDFFGAPGQAAYQDLEKKLGQSDIPPSTDQNTINDEVSTEAEASPQDVTLPESEEEMLDTTAEEINDSIDDNALLEKNEQSQEESGEEEQKTPQIDGNNTNIFEIQKVQRQLELLEQNRAWLAARCVQLKDIEIYAYPFYGFIVDMLRQVKKGMDALLENEEAAGLIDSVFEGGREEFNNKKEAIEHDIELAEQNCESAQTALISEDMDMDEVKRTLGAIDESDTVEYVGPAPDGFELLDDETPLDESAIKKQYEKLENMDAMTGKVDNTPPTEAEEKEENVSQNEQKGVQQRKLSFSLKRKKPTGEAG